MMQGDGMSLKHVIDKSFTIRLLSRVDSETLSVKLEADMTWFTDAGTKIRVSCTADDIIFTR